MIVRCMYILYSYHMHFCLHHLTRFLNNNFIEFECCDYDWNHLTLVPKQVLYTSIFILTFAPCRNYQIKLVMNNNMLKYLHLYICIPIKYGSIEYPTIKLKRAKFSICDTYICISESHRRLYTYTYIMYSHLKLDVF